MSVVVDTVGREGRLVRRASADEPDTVTLALPDGSEARVPADWLQEQDGGYRLAVRFEDLRTARAAPGGATIPVVEETLEVSSEPVEHAVRLRKVVREEEERITQPLLHEDLEIERVRVDRPVSGAVAAREEGDTLVIPLLEEEIVWHKRLVVREELRIRKRRRVEARELRVSRRREDVIASSGDEKS
ncbi:MAG TPA: YsnF/AvaK domain-containing protein [Burkholderiales bacterium]